jgi:Zn-dependent protease with chaperone function
MDFFERQDRARRHTKWLVVYFVLGVALLIVVMYAAALLIFVGTTSPHRAGEYYEGAPAPATLWHPQLFSGVAICTLAVIGLGSLFKTMELSQGGKAVADMLGGRPVSPTTSDPDERKLLDVVEEMALASGVPVPQVYVLPQERGINAFAAGHSTSDAVIAVTQGSVKLLNRDELQGVVGHEFSHILNGDMRLSLRLIGILYDTPQKLDQWFRWCVSRATDTLNKTYETTSKDARRSFQGQGGLGGGQGHAHPERSGRSV